MITKMNDALDASRIKREEGEKGFTLIELLVVVIIIGILAAIAIPVFLNQRNSAWEGAAKADLHNAQLAIETYATSHNGKYTGLDGTGVLASLVTKHSEGVTLEISGVTATTYLLSAKNINLPTATNTFAVRESGTIGGPAATAAAAIALAP